MQEVDSIVLVPRSCYLNVIRGCYPELDTNLEIPAEIYCTCDKLLGVSFLTTVIEAERAFKFKIVDDKKWCMARLKYGL